MNEPRRINPGRIVLATANPGKKRELAQVLTEVLPHCELVARPDDVPEVVEDADTFLGNARLKARALVDATGMAALADDSGLVVDALGGAPGVHSSRYAGEGATDADNVERLLHELGSRGVDDPQRRSARFVSVIVLLTPDGDELVAEGRVEGTITDEPRGVGGFGYDPVFVPTEGSGRTFAEMSEQEKNEISHRGRALRNLAEQLGGAPPG